MVVCRQTITAKVLHQNWCKVSQQKPWSCVVRQSPQKLHTRTGENWCKVSQRKTWSCVVRQSPQKYYTRTGAKFHSKSHGRVSSDNHRKSITPELVQSFTAKAMVVCGQTITAKVSHQNWCKVSQQKPWSCVVRQSPQKFHSKSHGRVWSDNHRKSFTPELVRTGAKFHSERHGRLSSDNHRKSITPELVQSFTAKAMVVCHQKITAKVLHQNWCKVSQQKPWSCVVRQSPQKFHTRTGAKFHSKSHGRVWSDNHRKSFTPELVRTGAKFHSERHGRVSSDNHRKSITPELVQSFTAKAMVVCGQTITAKVLHQNWCKVSQQKPWTCVVRQSPQKFHTRTGAKFHSKSHGRTS